MKANNKHPIVTTTYVATMYRWGNDENHSYVLGVFSSLENAKKAMKKEANQRGGKYEGGIVGFELDNTILKFMQRPI